MIRVTARRGSQFRGRGPDFRPVSREAEGAVAKRGNYVGTVIGDRWWRRYMANGFFARGNGSFELDAEGISFLRTLTRTPIRIPWGRTTGARLVTWHAGRWLLGRPILRVDWREGDLALASGFYLSADRAEMARFAADLNARIAAGPP